MKRVTFKVKTKIKENRKWIEKTYTIVEYTDADDSAIRLRALALNWELISIEVSK